MKRSLIALAFAAVAVAMQFVDAGKYRFNAGESTHDLVVQDVGSV